MTALKQGTAEWLDARKALVTATDIPVLLGLSPYKCEADLADEKRGLAVTESTVRMRMGSFLEPLILEEYEAATGWHAEHIHTMTVHGWQGASPDARVKGQRRLVELKWTSHPSKFADGLPRDIEAQVQWQLGVTGYPAADVAVLTPDKLLPVFSVDYDADLFSNLVAVAEDFRRRLAEGGPFSRDKDRIARDHPRDNGETMQADAEVVEAVKALEGIKAARKRMLEDEDRIKTALKDRMGPNSDLVGPGFHIYWRTTKDIEEIHWENIAKGLLHKLPETDRMAVVGLNTTVKPGYRPFRVVVDSEENE